MTTIPHIAPALATGLLLAQSIPPSEWWSPLANAGAMGVVLLFFMWQSSKKEDDRVEALRQFSNALNSNTQAMMVVVLALKNGDQTVTELAKKIADDTKPH